LFRTIFTEIVCIKDEGGQDISTDHMGGESAFQVVLDFLLLLPGKEHQVIIR